MGDHIDRAAEVIEYYFTDGIPGTGWGDDGRAVGLARALDDAGRLRRPDDPEVEIDKKFGQPSTCVVRSRGVVVFDGVSKEALLRDRADQIEKGEADE